MSSSNVIVTVNHTKDKDVKGVEVKIETPVSKWKSEAKSKSGLLRFLRKEGVFLSEKEGDVTIFRKSKKFKLYVPLESAKDFLYMMSSLKVKNTLILTVVDKLLDFRWLMDENGLFKVKDVLNEYNKRLLNVCSEFISALQSELDPSGHSSAGPATDVNEVFGPTVTVPPPPQPPVPCSPLNIQPLSCCLPRAPPPPPTYEDVKMEVDKDDEKTESVRSESEDSSEDVPVHPSKSRAVSCDGCNVDKFVPMFGTIYHCEDCRDFDLCGKCFKNQASLALGSHKASHNMTKTSMPFGREKSNPSRVHMFVSCDLCDNNSFISGSRYKCLECPDYDLCQDCALKQTEVPRHKLGYHRPTHTMAKIAVPVHFANQFGSRFPRPRPFASGCCRMPCSPTTRRESVPEFDSEAVFHKDISVDATPENKQAFQLFLNRPDMWNIIKNLDKILENSLRYEQLIDDGDDTPSDIKFAILQSLLEANTNKKDEPVAVAMPVEESIPELKTADESLTLTPTESAAPNEIDIESQVEKISDFLTRISLTNKGSSVLSGGDLTVEIYSNVGGQVYSKTINDFPPIYPGSTRKLNIDFGVDDYNKFSLYVAAGGNAFNWNYERGANGAYVQVPPSEEFIVESKVAEEEKTMETNIHNESELESETDNQMTDTDVESPAETEGLLNDEKSFVESIHAVILPTLPKESLSSSSSQVHNNSEYVDAQDGPDVVEVSTDDKEVEEDYDMMSSDDGEPDLSEYDILSPVDSTQTS